jgi:hypothetical protein
MNVVNFVTCVVTMGQDTIEEVSAKLKNLIGVESSSYVTTIERDAVRRFNEAVVGDPIEGPAVIKFSSHDSSKNLDRVPPTFLRSLRSGHFDEELSIDLPNILDGGSEWEFFSLLEIGDEVSVSALLHNVTLKETRSGKMLFIIWDIKYSNCDDNLVATQRATEIRY